MPDSIELLRVGQVAAVLNYAPWTVYEKIRRGELPAFRDGRTVRVSRAALEEFIRTREQNQQGQSKTPPASIGRDA